MEFEEHWQKAGLEMQAHGSNPIMEAVGKGLLHIGQLPEYRGPMWHPIDASSIRLAKPSPEVRTHLSLGDQGALRGLFGMNELNQGKYFSLGACPGQQQVLQGPRSIAWFKEEGGCVSQKGAYRFLWVR
eukprot:1157870-Pelagomonas_calceolata.AAC.10